MELHEIVRTQPSPHHFNLYQTIEIDWGISECAANKHSLILDRHVNLGYISVVVVIWGRMAYQRRCRLDNKGFEGNFRLSQIGQRERHEWCGRITTSRAWPVSGETSGPLPGTMVDQGPSSLALLSYQRTRLVRNIEDRVRCRGPQACYRVQNAVPSRS